MFRFKRKNKEGQVEEQPVTQEEFDVLEANSVTLESIQTLFGEEANAEGFDLATSISELIETNSHFATAFGADVEAEDFNPTTTLTELRASQTELNSIGTLVKDLKGATTLEKVKSINPESKTDTTKEDAADENGGDKTFQTYNTNKVAIKELARRGVQLAGVDYSQLN